MSEFICGEIYHVLNRGIEGRKIFEEEIDKLRFIHDLFEFNDTNPALNLGRKISKKEFLMLKKARPKRELLVEILAFCLMPNHFHLLLRQVRENGIVKFMQKLGTGYAMYFNKKYKRRGRFFETSFKAIHITQEAHFVHIPYYIHLNPLDLIEPGWREGKIKDFKKAMNFLENYRWSSFLDYIGKENFPSVTQREFLLKFWGERKNHYQNIKNWLKQMDLSTIQPLLLE
ncbi:transposase [Candidatus Parcubacteria bacterium]|nr:transposase [Candidatus Parcubacteria bacterium]